MALTKRLFAQASIWIRPNLWDVAALILVLSGVILLTYGSRKMSLPFQLGETIPISLDPKNLPFYGLETALRMFIALVFSLLFTFTIGTWAAKSERAGKVLIPMIDILQSVPVLGYLSITVIGFIAIFPNSMMGPECAAIFAVFTAQVWNMTLSFYQSLRTIPLELREATHMYHLNGWQRFWRLEVPFAIPGLLWNIMMSMSGSWFFIVASEAISVANQDITLPGIGSYIDLAIKQENWLAIGYAVLAMFLVILIYDQFIFRPLVAWSQKFHMTDLADEKPESWLLNLMQRTRFMVALGAKLKQAGTFVAQLNFKRLKPVAPPRPMRVEITKDVMWYSIVGAILIIASYYLVSFIAQGITWAQTGEVFVLAGFTALRVFVLILLCSLIWVPIGVYIGLNPKLARVIQPIAQFLAAFPANLLFPVFVIVIVTYKLNVEIWTAPLMVLGTQWYILFNVIAGAVTIPKELKAAAENMHLRGWLKWRRFLLPAIFPYYVTGAITAAGGSWNASIVAEVISWGHTTLVAHGLGAYITQSTDAGNFPAIALGVVMMCVWVTVINLLFWRKLYRYAEERFAL
jgi:NitT/TauT family transport system permease protein